MVKYIKVQNGFAINKKEAWIGHVQEEPEIEIIRNFLFSAKKIIKEDTKYFFDFGDKKQTLTITCSSKEEALKEWEKVFNIINEHQIIND
jgi:hypothetical protein